MVVLSLRCSYLDNSLEFIHEGRKVRLQGESQAPTVLLISLVELCQATIADELDQVYVVTHVHSFLFAIESENNSSCLNDVFVVETIKCGLLCNEQTKGLGGNLYFDKPVLTVCAHPKSKAKIDNTRRYADILGSLLSMFRDVFPVDLPDGLLPSQEVDNLIKVLFGLTPVSKPAYKVSHSKAHEVERQLATMGIVHSSGKEGGCA